MKIRTLLLLALFSGAFVQANAQDSAKVVAVFKELLAICKNPDNTGTQAAASGPYYRAAPYIVYRGDDENRNWKDAANYNNEKERAQVEDICFAINVTVNQDPEYLITGYETGKESEGEWHVIHVAFKKNERPSNIAFAFLKVGDRYLLGDID